MALALVLLVVTTAAAGMGIAQVVHAVQVHRYGSLSPICRVVTDRPLVALSFDDGPDPGYTPAVLALLHRYGDRATFFLIGEHASAYPGLVEQEINAGMEIGNHTWSHPDLPDLSVADALAEVVRTQDLLTQERMGAAPLFRAPLGEIGPDQLAQIEGMGLRPVHWSIALDHYVGGMGLAPGEAAETLARDVRPGDIILAHDARAGGLGRESAMAALRLLLPALGDRGFEVTTVGDLFAQGAAVQAKPRPWFWESGFTCPRP
jgi:peptidoglycan/xylan/chitin deacetylase (PgdA/CDA1 family)